MTEFEEDQLQETVEYLEKEVEKLDSNYANLLDDFADLLSILIDAGEISDASKQQIMERFFKTTKTNQNG